MKYLIFFLFSILAFGLDFSVVSKGENYEDNNTVLVFGGIQGDEPGGFHAASLLISDYEITKGRLLIAPNLAFESIIARSRGTHGDLNRKFAKLSKNDPDYETVKRIKSLILRKDVSMIINLHDGSGFYSPVFKNSTHNPKRWGNSAIIDQKNLESAKYKELSKIAHENVDNINKALASKGHKYHVKNTETKELDDKEMLKALTYFAIINNKSAFANEASKNLPTHLRVYYHLLAVEGYLKIAGIEYKRDFSLSPEGVKAAINKPIFVKLFDNSLIYLADNKASLRFIPFPVNWPLNYTASNELTAILPQKNNYFIQYGNRFKMRLYPEYFYFSDILKEAKIMADDELKSIKFGTKIKIKKDFLIPKIKGVRVNIIGLTKAGDESLIRVNKNMLKASYSMDKAARLYRVEFYAKRGEEIALSKEPSEEKRPLKTKALEIKNPKIKSLENNKSEEKEAKLSFFSKFKSFFSFKEKPEIKKELNTSIAKPHISKEQNITIKKEEEIKEKIAKEDLEDKVFQKDSIYGTKREIKKSISEKLAKKALKKDLFLGMILVEFQ